MNELLIEKELTRANVLKLKGEYEQAESGCLSVLKVEPENLTAITLLADICELQGQHRAAIQWLEMALEQAPNRASLTAQLQRVQQANDASEKTELGALLSSRSSLSPELQLRRRKQFAGLVLGCCVFGLSAVAIREVQNREHNLVTPAAAGGTLPHPSTISPPQNAGPDSGTVSEQGGNPANSASSPVGPDPAVPSGSANEPATNSKDPSETDLSSQFKDSITKLFDGQTLVVADLDRADAVVRTKTRIGPSAAIDATLGFFRNFPQGASFSLSSDETNAVDWKATRESWLRAIMLPDRETHRDQFIQLLFQTSPSESLNGASSPSTTGSNS